MARSDNDYPDNQYLPGPDAEVDSLMNAEIKVARLESEIKYRDQILALETENRTLRARLNENVPGWVASVLVISAILNLVLFALLGSH